MSTTVPPLSLPSVGDGLTDGDGLASGVADGVGEGLAVLPDLPEDVAVAVGLALDEAHGEADGVALAVRVALAVLEAGGEVVVKLGVGLRSGSGLGEAVCVGVSDGLVVKSVGDPGVVVCVAGLVVALAGGVVGGVVVAVAGGVVVAVAVGLVVAFGWSAAPEEPHEASADAFPAGLAVPAADPAPADWPLPSAVPPPFSFWPVIVLATFELSWPMAARTGGTASATPRANTAKQTAKAGRSTATCHCLDDRGIRRAWPPWCARRRRRSARNPPRAVPDSGACAWAGLDPILARIRSRPSACGSTWSAAACSAWRTKSGNSCPCACGPFGRRPYLTITPAPAPNAARSSRVRCGS